MKMKSGAHIPEYVPLYGIVSLEHAVATRVHVYARRIGIDKTADKDARQIYRIFGKRPKEVLTGTEFNRLMNYVRTYQSRYFPAFMRELVKGGELMEVWSNDGALKSDAAECVFSENLAARFLKDAYYLHDAIHDKRYKRVYIGMSSGQREFLSEDISGCLDAMENAILHNDFPACAYDVVMGAWRNARLIAELSVTVTGYSD